jgi:hypothetical protein
LDSPSPHASPSAGDTLMCSSCAAALGAPPQASLASMAAPPRSLLPRSPCFSAAPQRTARAPRAAPRTRVRSALRAHQRARTGAKYDTRAISPGHCSRSSASLGAPPCAVTARALRHGHGGGVLRPEEERPQRRRPPICILRLCSLRLGQRSRRPFRALRVQVAQAGQEVRRLGGGGRAQSCLQALNDGAAVPAGESCTSARSAASAMRRMRT